MIYIQRLFIHLCTSTPAAIEPGRRKITTATTAEMAATASEVHTATTAGHGDHGRKSKA